MFKFLDKAYPLIIEEGYLKVNIINIILSLTVFLFLYIIQPKLLYENFYYTFNTCFLFAGVTFLVSVFFTNVITRVFPTFFVADKWTVGKDLFFVFSIVLTIAITNYIIGAFVFYPNKEFEIIRFLKVVLSTLVVSIIPLGVFIIISQRINYNKLKAKSQYINATIEEHKEIYKQDKILNLSGQGKYEELQIESNTLLYVESTGNYCDIVYLQDDTIQKKTLRITLKNVHQQINLPDTIIKTHRSFLVNLNHITHTKGNAQGYQLSIKGINDFFIPVSRANVDFLNEKIKQL